MKLKDRLEILRIHRRSVTIVMAGAPSSGNPPTDALLGIVSESSDDHIILIRDNDKRPVIVPFSSIGWICTD